MSLFINIINVIKGPSRLGRFEYFIKSLFIIILIMAALFIILWFMTVSTQKSISDPSFRSMYFIAAAWIMLIKIRYSIARLHDVNLSGWWYIVILALSAIVGCGEIILLILPGTQGTNRFGECR